MNSNNCPDSVKRVHASNASERRVKSSEPLLLTKEKRNFRYGTHFEWRGKKTLTVRKTAA